MPETSEPFAVLLEQARQGDQDALAQLVQLYEPKVRLVARVLLGPALRPYLDSVDLVQSVHHSLLAGLRQQKFDISTPDKLMALALTVVRRKVARHWRHLQRQQRLSHGTTDTGNVVDLLTEVSSPQPDPARQAQFHDQVQQLWNSLDEIERRMLTLRLEGHSTGEIAEQLGLNNVTLRVRLTRLRQRLQANGVLDDWL